MQAYLNLVFARIHANKVIKLFGERYIATMIKWFKKFGEGSIPGDPVVIPLNPDELTDS